MEERQAILSLDFIALERLVRIKARILRSDIAQFSEKTQTLAKRNNILLKAVGEGIAEVQRNLKETPRSEESLATYDRSGCRASSAARLVFFRRA